MKTNNVENEYVDRVFDLLESSDNHDKAKQLCKDIHTPMFRYKFRHTYFLLAFIPGMLTGIFLIIILALLSQ